ncbi:DUF305 domain-containing protein [Lentzea sp. CA-135723]|uniref:DUF305 domain-containing protein n=1 Tax=Lentzea sp. CA-135723 TaxID=3239950 RepID=UPI003D922D87
MNWELLLILVFLGIALLVIGLVVGTASAKQTGPAEADVEFARAMSAHHRLALRVAVAAGVRSSDSQIRLLAFEVETSRLEQIGRMAGWLDLWKREPAEDVAQPETRMSDVSFLHFMVLHDDKGIALADRALATARLAPVRRFARKVRARQLEERDAFAEVLAARDVRSALR